MLLLLLLIPLFLFNLSLFLLFLLFIPHLLLCIPILNPPSPNASPHVVPPLTFILLDLSSPLWNGEQDLKLQNAAIGVLHLQCLVMLDLSVIHCNPEKYSEVKAKL